MNFPLFHNSEQKLEQNICNNHVDCTMLEIKKELERKKILHFCVKIGNGMLVGGGGNL